MNIYIIHTSEDKNITLRLLDHLKPFEQEFEFSVWHDDSIQTGQQWKPQNEFRIADTDLFLLMVSNTFMYSEFISQIEFKWIIDSYKAGDSKVIPVLIDECPWDTSFNSDEYDFSFKELLVLPEGRKPISDWNSQEEACRNTAAGIKDVLFTFNEDSEQELKAEDEKNSIIEEKKGLKTVNFSKKEKATRKAKEDRRLLEKVEAKAKRNKQHQQKGSAQAIEEVEGIEQEVNTEIKSNFLKGALVVLLAIFSVWGFAEFHKRSAKSETESIRMKLTNIKDSLAMDKTKADSLQKIASFMKLTIGKIYEGGIIFSIDSSNKTGKIVRLDDVGPMPWQKAIKIGDQLGEGWRLPSFNELIEMQGTVGQGSNNKAEFSNGLYWSSTIFEEHQARLLRFRDANTSYHYNRNVETRSYKVRAVKDFKQ